MSIFKDVVVFDSGGLDDSYRGWIEWFHSYIPKEPEWLRTIIRALLMLMKHCLKCSALNGCYLLNIKRPKQPLHERCHCMRLKINVDDVKTNASSECAIEKFTKYIFGNNSKGKNQIFYKMGFSIDDSEYLQKQYCEQALNSYLRGQYELRELDIWGQRLAIPINLNGVYFYSGCMLCPEGKIKNTTPFGGWIE